MTTAAHLVSPEEVMGYLDGELPPSEANLVSVHIAECRECAELAEQFRDTTRLLAAWTVESASAAMDSVVLTTQTSDSSTHSRSSHKPSMPRRPFNRKQWALAGMAACLLLAIGVSSYHSSRAARLKAYSEPQMDARNSYAAQATETPVPSPPVPLQRKQVIGGGGGGGGASVPGDTIQAPMIARTVALTILVKDVNRSRATLDAILARYNGYAAQLTATTPENASRSFQASLRIPASELAAALNDFKTLGRVQNESQSGEEVTQQHADLVARLKNSHETEVRLQAILQQRTGKIEDVLQVEEEIARVRGEIETMEADQKALEHRVDFATVDLQLTEEYKAQLNAPADSVMNRMRNALVTGYRNASGLLLGILLFFAEYGPALLILLAILGVPAYVIRNRYRKMLDRI
jgi:hypothetical protein